MPRKEPSGFSSESEFEESENLSEEEELDEERNVKKQGISDYEKQRLSRIAENKSRMEALGLHKMASSLMGAAQKSNQSLKASQGKGKSKTADDDDDYMPNNEDADDDDEDDDEDNDEGFVSQSSSKSSKNKVKNKVAKSNKKVPLENRDEKDHGLMQAIALSLQDSADDATFKERKENANIVEETGRKKRKRSSSNRVQMTEDELVLHFFQFDELGRGFITVRDLQRLAMAHDFAWTDRELADMVHCFDSDGDGKLNLEDFRRIAGHCNMIQGSENS